MSAASRILTVSQAINEGLREEMRRNPEVILIGEDIGALGGIFGVTKGLLDEFGPERVLEPPIAEYGFTGLAVGAAMRGLRPVVELMFSDFVSVAMDPILNQAAKMRYMSGGRFSVPLVLRAPRGSGDHYAGQHSQCLEAWFAHIPGLKVVCPSTPADAKGLIRSAVRDPDPVVFLEHKLTYGREGEVPAPGSTDAPIPLGLADVKRPGRDLTIICWSRQVFYALEAAEELAAGGIEAEVLDLRSLVPLDWEAVRQSVAKTRRVLIVEEAVRRGGFGAELSAQINEDFYGALTAPVKRLAGKNVVIPFSPGLEEAAIPQIKDILDAARAICSA